MVKGLGLQNQCSFKDKYMLLASTKPLVLMCHFFISLMLPFKTTQVFWYMHEFCIYHLVHSLQIIKS